MNTRLQQFLELENLTPARLADMLGVQRSGLSHILSGRNKPSYDFLTRILTKFPHINADWLMTGRGKAYRESNESVIISAPLPPSATSQISACPSGKNFQDNGQIFQTAAHNLQQRQFGTFSNGQSLQSSQPGPAPYVGLAPENSPILDNLDGMFPECNLDSDTANTANSIDTENISTDSGKQQPSENRVNGMHKVQAGQKKRIKRVIVFYSDGSFEELFPHIG